MKKTSNENNFFENFTELFGGKSKKLVPPNTEIAEVEPEQIFNRIQRISRDELSELSAAAFEKENKFPLPPPFLAQNEAAKHIRPAPTPPTSRKTPIMSGRPSQAPPPLPVITVVQPMKKGPPPVPVLVGEPITKKKPPPPTPRNKTKY